MISAVGFREIDLLLVCRKYLIGQARIQHDPGIIILLGLNVLGHQMIGEHVGISLLPHLMDLGLDLVLQGQHILVG